MAFTISKEQETRKKLRPHLATYIDVERKRTRRVVSSHEKSAKSVNRFISIKTKDDDDNFADIHRVDDHH
jgi:hypothetical protein